MPEDFTAKIFIIGVNPYVLLPKEVLQKLFKDSGKSKGPIPVKGTFNSHRFTQTLVKYQGKWRLYLNTPMRKATGLDVGDSGKFKIQFDAKPPQVEMPPALEKAFKKNKKVLAVFNSLPPSRQKEIKRYIGFLKNEESIEKNVKRAMAFLIGKERFVGRDKP